MSGLFQDVRYTLRQLRKSPGFTAITALTLNGVMQDIRYALRQLRKNPGFAAVAVVTLALSVGVNTAIFSVVNSVLLQKLPFRNPGQLVLVQEPTANDQGFAVSVANFEEYRAQQNTFQDLSLWIAQSVNLTGREQPDRVLGAFTSSNFFSLLGVQAIQGRTFLVGEDTPGAERVAVVSYSAWKSRFSGDPNFLGKQLTLNGESYNVVGILPPSFHFPMGDSDVWMTIQHYPNYRPEVRSAKSQLLIGRIKDGITYQAATANLDLVAQRLAAAYPADNAGIVLGIAGALAATRLLKQLLYGVGANDPLTLALVLGVMIGVTLLAIFVPARRAARVDPMVALRYE